MNDELKVYFKIFAKLSMLVGGLLFFDWMVYPRLISFFYDNMNASQYCFKQAADILVLGDSHTERTVRAGSSTATRPQSRASASTRLSALASVAMQ